MSEDRTHEVEVTVRIKKEFFVRDHREAKMAVMRKLYRDGWCEAEIKYIKSEVVE